MAELKRQHYVPMFLLRNFSSDKKSISLFNIKKGQVVNGASIKTQCAEDYFYGKDPKFEKALGQIEGHTNEILKTAFLKKKLPPLRSEGHHAILVFVAFQAFRTLYMTDTINESVENIVKSFLRVHLLNSGDSDISEEDIESTTVTMNNLPRLSLGFISMGLPLLYDLKMKLVRNRTKIKFILSDNPAVLYNKMFLRINEICVTGMPSKGLLIFLPITPVEMVVFYDPQAYRVGRDFQFCVTLQKELDVLELNTLQFINCYENLYFLTDEDQQIQKIVSQNSSWCRREKTGFEQGIAEKKSGSFILLSHTRRNDIKYPVCLSFLKELKGKTGYDVEFGDRNSHLTDTFKEFEKLVKERKYKPTEWDKFIQDEKNRLT